MLELPVDSVLGKLTLGAVFEYYDFPRLFTCQSVTGQTYLAVSTFDDEYESRWLYLPLSPIRIAALLRSELPVRVAFLHPEGGYVARVHIEQESRRSLVEYLLPEQVPAEDLPDEDYLLRPQDLLPEPRAVARPSEVALATRRETFDYRIFPGNPLAHEIPARKFGAILTSTQELLDALGQAATGQPTVRGPIPADLLLKTKVQVSNVFHGSFGVQFRAAERSDLLDDSLICEALHELANLLLAFDSEDLLSNKLHSLKGRVASKYRRLLKELVDLDSGLMLEWGSPKGNRGGAFELTATQVRAAYAIVDRIDIALAEEVQINGQLVGFNVRTKRYEIQSGTDGRSYAGRVSEEADIRVANPAIGEQYQAVLRMLVETQSTSGDELVRWVLVRLGPLPTKAGA